MPSWEGSWLNIVFEKDGVTLEVPLFSGDRKRLELRPAGNATVLAHAWVAEESGPNFVLTSGARIQPSPPPWWRHTWAEIWASWPMKRRLIAEARIAAASPKAGCVANVEETRIARSEFGAMFAKADEIGFGCWAVDGLRDGKLGAADIPHRYRAPFLDELLNAHGLGPLADYRRAGRRIGWYSTKLAEALSMVQHQIWENKQAGFTEGVVGTARWLHEEGLLRGYESAPRKKVATLIDRAWHRSNLR